MMVGREVMLQVDKKKQNRETASLRSRTRGRRPGWDLPEWGGWKSMPEIVGVAGVQGNGQTELVEVLTGLRPLKTGYQNRRTWLERCNTSRITDRGKICHVPEDRHSYGMVDNYSVADNLVLNSYYRSLLPKEWPFGRNPSIQMLKLWLRNSMCEHLRSRPRGKPFGGNQQKMVIARELSRPIQLMIAAQPVRGIDVGSIEFIHNRSSQNGMKESPCCLSVPNWMKSWHFPIGSWWCTGEVIGECWTRRPPDRNWDSWWPG